MVLYGCWDPDHQGLCMRAAQLFPSIHLQLGPGPRLRSYLIGLDTMLTMPMPPPADLYRLPVQSLVSAVERTLRRRSPGAAGRAGTGRLLRPQTPGRLRAQPGVGGRGAGRAEGHRPRPRHRGDFTDLAPCYRPVICRVICIVRCVCIVSRQGLCGHADMFCAAAHRRRAMSCELGICICCRRRWRTPWVTVIPLAARRRPSRALPPAADGTARSLWAATRDLRPLSRCEAPLPCW